jgi:hypothetical protein
MQKLKEHLGQYCRVMVGIEGSLKGLEHNTQFQAFVNSTEPMSLLIGVDEKTSSFVIGAEFDNTLDAWLLVTKGPQTLQDMRDLASGLQISMASDINDLKECMVENIATSFEGTDDSTISDLIPKLTDIIKTDLYSNPDYLDRVIKGNLSTVQTFSDELNVQRSLKAFERESSLGQAKDLDEMIIALAKMATYTDPAKQLNSAQIDSSISQIVDFFRDMLMLTKTSTKLKPRVLKLIEIYAERLYQQAQSDNSQIDLFDCDECNLRLTLSSWKVILKTYQTSLEDMAAAYQIDVSQIFGGSYSDYLKRITTATYIRGILDELIRYTKYNNLQEIERKLQEFNDKRQAEKMKSKEEREYFFNQFGSNLMEIISYVQTSLVPQLGTNPKHAVQETKKWNNILTYKKNTPEVKEVREAVLAAVPKLTDSYSSSCGKLASKNSDFTTNKDWIRGWKEDFTEFQNIRSTISILLEGFPSADQTLTKYNSVASKYEEALKKFMAGLEHEISSAKDADLKLGKKLEIYIEEDLYVFCSAPEVHEQLADICFKLKNYKLESHFSANLKQFVEECLALRDIGLRIKQIMQNVVFQVEKTDPSLLDVLKIHPAMIELMKYLRKKTQSDHLLFQTVAEADAFLKQLLIKVENCMQKIKTIGQSHLSVVNSIQNLAGFKLLQNESFWETKLSTGKLPCSYNSSIRLHHSTWGE